MIPKKAICYGCVLGGWLLLAPIPQRSKGAFALSDKWVAVKSFDAAETCESARKERTRHADSLADLGSEAHFADLNFRCVSSDDPNLIKDPTHGYPVFRFKSR
jgi:hypothetical protein